MKKILLVLPNKNWSDKKYISNWSVWPTALCALAAMIPEHEVTIVDANIDNMNRLEFVTILDELEPDIVGISFWADDFADGGYETAQLVKVYCPNCIIIAGGNYITLNYEEIMISKKHCNVDYLVPGEAEIKFKLLIKMLNDHKKCYDIANTIENLDALPPPDYSLIDFAKYSNYETKGAAYSPDAMPYGRINTSRGCPLNCCYCQNKVLFKGGIRYQSVERVLNDIKNMICRYGIKSLLIDDANFTADKERAKEIMRGMIGMGLKWKAMNLAVFTLDEEMLALMLASGCDYIDLAIESGSQRVLKEIMRKPVDIEKTKCLIVLAKRMGFRIAANFIIGFPGETWEEIRQTIKLAEDIDIDYVRIQAAMPLKGTELARIATEQSCLQSDFDYNNMRWGTGEISTNEFSAKDITALRIYEWDRINFATPEKIDRVARLMHIDHAQIDKMRRETRKGMI